MMGSAEIRVAIVSNTAWSIWNFRRGLISKLLQHGISVTVLAPPGPFVEQIERLGCRFIPLQRLAPKGKQVGRDLLLIRELRRRYKEGKYDWILSYTIKPNLYTGLSIAGLPVRWAPTVNGLGVIFLKNNWLGALAKTLYRRAFRRADCVFFQNPDDRLFFENKRMITPEKARQVAGSGVNLEEFAPVEDGHFSKDPVFLLAARLIAEKGVFEYLEAAQTVKSRFPNARFLLAGLPAENPNALSRKALASRLQAGTVELIPPTDDMPALLDAVQCVVLPSYYGEGVPRVLLEALAKGLPVITTDMPGCRDTVVDGRNGWLVPPRNSAALSAAMLAFCEMSPQLRADMGKEGRHLAQQTFDEQIIIQKYLELVTA
ncbi:MAG: glycosyltransferase family 4 protein [Saprospiraceae bacterium]|nr:glycosyltransferase family 4 protein [Saprospiraceae bacterium]